MAGADQGEQNIASWVEKPPYVVRRAEVGVDIATKNCSWKVRLTRPASGAVGYLGRVIQKNPGSPSALYEITLAEGRPGVKVCRLTGGVNTGQLLDLAMPVPDQYRSAFQLVPLDHKTPEGDAWRMAVNEIVSFEGTGSMKEALEKPFNDAGLVGFRDDLVKFLPPLG